MDWEINTLTVSMHIHRHLQTSPFIPCVHQTITKRDQEEEKRPWKNDTVVCKYVCTYKPTRKETNFLKRKLAYAS